MVKACNAELRTEIICKDPHLKLVREIRTAYEVAKEESVMIDADTAHKARIEEQEVKRISKPGRYSPRNNERGQLQGKPLATSAATKHIQEE